MRKEGALVDQSCPNSAVTAKIGSGLAQNRSLDSLATPTIALTLRTTSNSRHGYLYEVALDGEVIVAASRDPQYDACRELLKPELRGIAGAQLMTKEGA